MLSSWIALVSKSASLQILYVRMSHATTQSEYLCKMPHNMTNIRREFYLASNAYYEIGRNVLVK